MKLEVRRTNRLALLSMIVLAVLALNACIVPRPATGPQTSETATPLAPTAPEEPAPSDQPPTLQGAAWQLSSYVGADGAMASPAAPATLGFQDNEVTGSGGCNSFFAPFSVEGNQFVVGPPGSTMMACDQPIMDQEAAYLTALAQSARYEIKDNELRIYDKDGGLLLTFARSGDAVGGDQPGATPSTRGPEGVDNVVWQWVEAAYADGSTKTVDDPARYTLTLRPDGAVEVQIDCNLGSGSYVLSDQGLTLSINLTTRVACAQGSLADAYLRDLNQVAGYQVAGDKLTLTLTDGGVLTFVSAGPAESAAGAAGGLWSASALATAVDGVANSIQWQLVPAQGFSDSEGPMIVGAPEHLLATFDGQSVDEARMQGRYIMIMPLPAYQQIWAEGGSEVISRTLDSLQTLLAERPAAPSAPLPVLPPPGAVNDVAVQNAYLAIPGLNASGVRWIGRFTQDLTPVMNWQLRYLFQGVTADGQYLVAASYPVSTAMLPNEQSDMTPDELKALDENPQLFLEATTSALTFLASTDFTPSLDALDAMMQSLAVDTTGVTVSGPVTPTLSQPVEDLAGAASGAVSPQVSGPLASSLTGVTWLWNNTTRGDLVIQLSSNPDRYQVTFNESGTVQILADCNRAAGVSTINGNDLTLSARMITRSSCAEGSLSQVFLDNLNLAARWNLNGEGLVIELKDGSALHFVAQP